MNIQAVRTAPRSPWQNAYVERVIGSIRRECLDHVIVANATGLHRVLTEYVGYYMRSRTHLALGKDARPRVRPCRRRLGASSRRRKSAGSTTGTIARRRSQRPTSTLLHRGGSAVYVEASCSPLTPPSANAHTLRSWTRAVRKAPRAWPTTERSLNQTRIDFVIGTAPKLFPSPRRRAGDGGRGAFDRGHATNLFDRAATRRTLTGVRSDTKSEGERTAGRPG
jgi:Integrase core domain